MRTAIDTNVLSALWSQEPLSSQVASSLWQFQNEGGLVICAPVYVELLAHPKASAQFVDNFLTATNISVEFSLDEAIWRNAGHRFVEYAQRRRRSKNGSAKRLLVDFLVGAHAHRRADRLFTLDKNRYARYFPDLALVPQT